MARPRYQHPTPASPITLLRWRGGWGAGAGLAFVVTLALGFAALRAVGQLGPPQARVLLPLGFVGMALAPLLLLDRTGWRQIGLAMPSGAAPVLRGVFAGAAAALACFGLAWLLAGAGPDNPFMTIAASYRATFDTSGLGPVALYLAFTAPAVLFSPIGEEMFFRGLLQRALEQRCGAAASTAIECGAFGVVHLCHHGLAPGTGGAAPGALSALLWVVAMGAVGWLFAALRRRSGSLLPAVAAHAAFNMTMNGAIFGLLW